MHKACSVVCTTAGAGVWVEDRVVFCYVVCRWYAMDHATRQHGVKKRAGTCHMLPKQRGDLSCAPHLRRMKCVPMPRGAASEVACARQSEVSFHSDDGGADMG